MKKSFIKRFSRTQVISLGFLAVIALGTLLLLLPFATRNGQSTSVIDALFTSASATCVTGLVVYDTFTHWTLFGQLVILTLIQIGGLGFMTLIATFNLLIKKKMGLHNRMLIMESAGEFSLSRIGKLVRRITEGTLLFELIGAIFLSTQFIPKMGIAAGTYSAIFHSISAFCNAGFDIMGRLSPGSSMTLFYDNPVVNITLIFLIVIGGIGFFVWSDLLHCKLNFKKYQLHTKLVLSTTAVLILFGWVLFYVFEYDEAFADMTVPKKIMASLFQSVTPRTAGFNSVDLSNLSEPGSILTILFMFIGGSPGSTAGGVKTTTVAVMLLSTVAYAQKDHDVTIFHYKIEERMIRRASAIMAIYFSLIFVSSIIITAIEPLDLMHALFEVVSAVGTVGLSMGVTPTLSAASRVIIIILMYAGRIGALTFIVSLSKKNNSALLTRPTGKIMIG